MATSAPTKPFSIAIVGGGITGLTLAIGLLKHHIPVTIYESASHFGEIGAGVGFGPNAARAIELISPQMKEAFERCLTRQWESKKHIWFTMRVGDRRKAGDDGVLRQKEEEGLKVGDPVFEVHFTDPEGTRGGVHRAHFLNQLVKLIPDSVPKFGKKLIDVSDASDSEDVVLHFADGTTARHTAILGCDGIKSRTRELLLGKDEAGAVFSGKYVYRGLIPMTKAVEMLGEEQAQNSQMYMGYHGHILTFPIEKGKTMNVVAFNSRETWTDPEWVVRTSKEDMLSDFRNWGPAATAVVSAVQKPDIWALFNHRPAKTYYDIGPRMCLVGDAAHASTPHQGAGAAMCIEDCYILSNLLAKMESVQDLERAFKAYDEVRRPRTQKLVETSREAARLYEFELEGDDLEAIQRNIQGRMGWIWDIDLEGELERAGMIYNASLITPSIQ